jgi:hypothetical protein
LFVCLFVLLLLSLSRAPRTMCWKSALSGHDVVF